MICGLEIMLHRKHNFQYHWHRTHTLARVSLLFLEYLFSKQLASPLCQLSLHCCLVAPPASVLAAPPEHDAVVLNILEDYAPHSPSATYEKHHLASVNTPLAAPLALPSTSVHNRSGWEHRLPDSAPHQSQSVLHSVVLSFFGAAVRFPVPEYHPRLVAAALNRHHHNYHYHYHCSPPLDQFPVGDIGQVLQTRRLGQFAHHKRVLIHET
ncbi:hypothetical protein VPH35_007414 [Triticum aestivum]